MLLLGSSSVWARTFSKGDVLFIDATNCSWYEGDGCNASIYFWGTNTIGPVHTTRISDRLYYYTFTSAVNVSNFKVFRQPTSSSGWDNQYNGFESDFNLMGTHNTIKINGNSDGYSWADYKPTSTGKLTASSTDVKTGESVTLTPSLTSNTTYNTIKSTTYSISPSSGANISGSTFTATEAGTYTVTATITYNPKGYSSLTSTVKPTVQITVTSSCTPPILTLSETSADANKGDDVNLTTLSGATASSGTVEWYTTENSTTATSASVTVSETKTYYARAVGDCKSDAKSFTINAKCTNDFYLVGASADIFGSVWTPAQTANKMNCDLNSLTKTYTNITVAADTTIEYKITDSNGWQGAQYPSSGNASFEIKTAGKYNITFTAQTDGSNIKGTPKVEWELACNDLPNDAYSIKEVNKTAEWTGSNITPIITKSNNEYPNPTVTYNGKSALPKDVGPYTVKATVSGDATYCDEEFDLGTFTITCPTLTAPTLSVDQHIVKCGTDVTQKGKITISGLVTGNTYTYKVGDNGTAQSLTFTGTSATLSDLETGGEYIVTASNGCDTESANDIVNVTTNTKATLSWNMPAKGFLVADETIEAVYTPEGAGSITYSTSDAAVIALNGKLTAQPNKNGTANITATPSLNPGYCGATAITENNVPVKFFNVAGTANLCGDAWNTTANPMTYNNGVWSKTFEAKPADVYEFQISREEWDGNWEDRKKIYSDMGNIKCEEIHRTDGGDWYNIEFTTPTKGDITIKFTEGKGSYVEFEPICITEDDVTVGPISADKDQYNYNETAKLSIADATIDAAYGSVYSISYQWQEKNGDKYTDIQGATGKTYEAKNLTIGNHTYRVAVTYSYSGFNKTCTDTKYSTDKTINVTCSKPEKPTVNVISHTSRCKDGLTKGKVEITNYDPDCLYYMGQNESPFNVTVEDNKAYIYFELEDTNSTTYTIRAKSKCGTNSAQSEYSDSSEQFTVNYTDNTPTVKVSISGGNSICAGETTTLIANISDLKGTITSYVWSPEGGIINDNTYTTPALNETKSFIVRLNVVNEGCEKAFTATAYNVTVNPIPSVTLGLPNVGICKGEAIDADLNFLAIPEVTNGVAVWYDSETGGNVITQANLEKAGTYWVAAENSETGCKSPKREQFTTVINELPKYPELGKTSASVCQDNAVVDLGKLANVDAVVWYQNGEEVERPNQISIANKGEFKYLAKAVDPNTGCKSAEGVEFTLTVDAQPTFTVPAATQTNKEVTLTSAAGASTQWSVSPTENVTLTNNGDGTATFVATANGDYTITASNGVCAQVSPTIKVSDAFYIWVRNAKKGETAYTNFYHSDQNSEKYRGGEMFYAECDALPANGTSDYKKYNEGGRAADLVKDDCDGYTWYGFKASEEVISGTKYFYVHPKNDINYGGWYTHTVPTKVTLTSDVYYVLGDTYYNDETGKGYYGWKIVSASAPYAGPRVYASGDAKFNSNNFADFVSLYVTDCSGKEVTGYQWSYTAPTCTYVGKKTVTMSASTTNNIRVREAGNYTCTVTYNDGSTTTSPELTVSTGATDTPTLAAFTSNLPIIMVNTNEEGFPDCTGLSGQTASKNASTLKAKRSVDVIIKEGDNVIYDRKARMAYRGSSSLNFVKKSYAFCPGDANCGDKEKGEDYVKTAKLNMLGIGDAYDKDWVLYAAAADPSLMRNRLVFDSFKEMTGGWSVNSRYVELIVDGVYKGVYVFMDKITMNENRVNVNEDTGFIVKFDKTDKEDRIGGYNGKIGDEKTFNTDNTGKYDIKTYDTYVDQLFEIEYPEKDDYPTGWSSRTTAIKNMFNNFEKALKEGNYTTVQQYIDYTSWADWFIISEYAKNVDAYRASCIFVYSGEPGAKIEARPLWDQELSFNNTATTVGDGKGCNITSGLLIQNSGVYSDAFPAPFWFTGGTTEITGGLLKDPCFVQVVKERWEIHKTGALSQSTLENRIKEYYNELADYNESTKQYAATSAKTREAAFWSGKSRGTCDCSYDTGNATATGYSNKTIEESKATMDAWILDAQRRTGLSTAISGLTGTTMNIQVIPSSQEITPWEAATITINKSDGYDYTLENDLDGVSGVVVQENGNSITYRIPRPSDWGYGDGNDSREDITYTIKATLNVASGTMVCGSTAAPSSTATIILQDEEDENCDE